MINYDTLIPLACNNIKSVCIRCPKIPVLGPKKGPKYNFAVITGQKHHQSDKNHI